MKDKLKIIKKLLRHLGKKVWVEITYDDGVVFTYNGSMLAVKFDYEAVQVTLAGIAAFSIGVERGGERCVMKIGRKNKKPICLAGYIACINRRTATATTVYVDGGGFTEIQLISED